MSSGYREKGRAVVLAALMVLSVVAMTTAFAGGAAADATSLTGGSVDDVSVGQETATQDVQFDVDIDADSTDHVLLNVDTLDSKSDVSVDAASASGTSAVSASVDDVRDANSADANNNTVSSTGERLVVVELQETAGSSQSGETITVTVEANTAGQSTDTSLDYKVEAVDGSGEDTGFGGFDLVEASSITVTEDNNNDINYAVSNVVTDGTVTVEDGTYSNGAVTADVSGVMLQAADGATPTIDAESGGFGATAVDVQAPGVTIDGLEIIADNGHHTVSYDPGASGERLKVNNSNIQVADTSPAGSSYAFGLQAEISPGASYSPEIVVDNVTFTNATSTNFDNTYDGAAIRAYATDTVTATDSTIENLQYGVQLAGGSGHEVKSTGFTRINTEAVIVNSDSSVDIDGADVSGNTFETVGAAIIFQENSGTVSGDLAATQNSFTDVRGDDLGGAATEDIAVLTADSGNYDGTGTISATVNATNNWWDDATGPSADGPGSGLGVDADDVTTTQNDDLNDGSSGSITTSEPVVDSNNDGTIDKDDLTHTGSGSIDSVDSIASDGTVTISYSGGADSVDYETYGVTGEDVTDGVTVVTTDRPIDVGAGDASELDTADVDVSAGGQSIDGVRLNEDGTADVILASASDASTQIDYASNDVQYAPWLNASDGSTIATESTTPSEVTRNESATTTVDIAPFPSGVSADYVVRSPTGSVVDSGTTTSDTISFAAEYDEIGNYTLDLNFGGSNPVASQQIVLSNYDFDVTTDPADPEFDDSVTFSGTISDNDGGVATDVSVYDPDDSELQDTTSIGDGTFSLSTTMNDADGNWTYRDDSLQQYNTWTIDTFTVDAAQANVDVTADGDNLGGFSETYTITLTDKNGDALAGGGADAGETDGGSNFDNYDGYLNVTGFTSDTVASVSTGDVITDITDEGNYLHVIPNSTGEIEFTATPNSSSAAVVAELENGDNVGLEESGDADTPGNADYLGSASLSIDAGEDLNVDVEEDEIAATDDTDLNVNVRGSDGEYPDADGDSALANATIEITGPGVDLSAGPLNESGVTGDAENDNANPVTFKDVTPDEAGTISVDVTAYDDDGNEFTKTATVDATGDIIESISPSEVNVDDNQNVSVEVTNADGVPVNSREVVVQANGSNAELTVWDKSAEETVTGVTELNIDGANNEITTDDGTQIDGSLVVNNGVYTAENVTFSATGSFDVFVDTDNSDSEDFSAQSNEAIAVQGINAYDVESDTTPALAGANETHNLTISQDGAAVNGSDLDAFSLEYAPSDDVAEVTAPSVVDLDEDGTNDAIQVELRTENATEPLNITVDDGEARTGTASIDVVEPQISTTLGADKAVTSKVYSPAQKTLQPELTENVRSCESEAPPACVYSYTRIHTVSAP